MWNEIFEDFFLNIILNWSQSLKKKLRKPDYDVNESAILVDKLDQIPFWLHEKFGKTHANMVVASKTHKKRRRSVKTF